MKKFLVVVVLVAILGLIGWQVKVKIDQKTNIAKGRRVANAIPVEIQAVRRQTILRTGEFGGSLMPLARSVIAPKVSGRLEKVLVNIGDPVKKGDLLALLDNREYTHQVKEVEAQLDVTSAGLREADSDLNVAYKNYERKLKLVQREVISASEFEAAEAAYQAALATRNEVLAQIKQRKAAVKTAQTVQSYTEIRADWDDGLNTRYVSERFVDEGTMLGANNALVSIVDISGVIAVINVIERDYPQIEIGMPATISTDAYPGRTFEGKVVRKAPILKETSRQARVEIEIPNTDHLLAPGMFVRAVLQFEKHADAAVVPIEALVKRNEKEGVFVADMNAKTAKFVPIKTGIRDQDLVEVLSPELDGPVVTLGHHLLVDGTAIMLPGDRKKPDGAPGGPPEGPPDGRKGPGKGKPGKPGGGQS